MQDVADGDTDKERREATGGSSSGYDGEERRHQVEKKGVGDGAGKKNHSTVLRVSPPDLKKREGTSH